jgi:TonB family protein
MILAAMLAIATVQNAPLNPSGKWIVDYRPDMCVAQRSFGEATAATVFGFEPAVAMDSGGAKLLILSPDTRGVGVRHGRAEIVLQPSGEKQTSDFVSWSLKSSVDHRALEMSVDKDFMAKLGKSTGLSVVAGKDSFELATGPLQAVLAAMKTCNDDLMRSWGIDPTAIAAAIGNPGDWFTDDDCPASAKRRGASGGVVVVLTVDPSGRTKACRVVSSSKDPDLDEATCDLGRRRGRFQPQTGDRYSILSIRWVLADM